MRAKIPLFFFMEATFHFENLVFTHPKETDIAIFGKGKRDIAKRPSVFKQFPIVEIDAATVF